MVLAVSGCTIPSYTAGTPDQRILLNDSVIISCQCPKTVLSCGDLERPHAAPVRRVREFLDSLGFFHARWDTLPPGRYAVAPGSRAIIASENISADSPAVIDSLPSFACPRRYDAGELRERVTDIGRRLAEQGYPYAAIAVAMAPFGANDSLAVTFRVQPDRRCLFAAPRLAGAKSTKQRLLLRDVLVKKGEVFDIRKIEASLEALRRRQYIACAEAGAIAALPDELRDTAAAKEVDYVVVPFLLKDRTGLGIEGALGMNTRQGEGMFLQGDLTVSLLNLFHSGEAVSLLYAGDKTYQKFHAEAAKPWLFGYPLTASGSFGLEVHEKSYGYFAGDAMALIEIQRRWNAGLSLEGSETTSDYSGLSWHYYGAGFLLSRLREPFGDNVLSSELALAAGGGIAKREERNFTRSHVEFTGGVHIPTWRHQAFRVRVISKHLITNEIELGDPEMYRVGGYRSVRGYQENEFAFRTVGYDQLEYLYYFSARGSAYIFLDDGVGFKQSLTRVRWGDRREFLGYGAGIRIPARLGILTLEWARNISDKNSFGRIHVQVSNNNVIE